MIQIGSQIATIDSPIDHLMACHRRIEQRLETLLNAAEHVGRDRAAALDAISKSLSFLDTSGALHTEDEEASLFPRLRRKLSAPEIAFIDSLEAQHAEAESIHAELKQLAAELNLGSESSLAVTGKYRNCAKRLQSLYQAHIRAEDEILTALARRSLDAGELAEISREMRERRASR
jgi:hemerythrin-like domain-containing protein